MHFFSKTFFVVLCAIFAAPIYADDIESVMEQNYPYEEVDKSYGAAKIDENRCKKGTPFLISQEESTTSTKLDIAKRIHEKIRSLGANALVTTDLIADPKVRSIVVTPLTCDLR